MAAAPNAPSSSQNEEWVVVSNDEILRFYNYVQLGDFDDDVALFGALFVLFCLTHPQEDEPDPKRWATQASDFINAEANRLTADVVAIPEEFKDFQGKPS